MENAESEFGGYQQIMKDEGASWEIKKKCLLRQRPKPVGQNQTLTRTHDGNWTIMSEYVGSLWFPLIRLVCREWRDMVPCSYPLYLERDHLLEEDSDETHGAVFVQLRREPKDFAAHLAGEGLLGVLRWIRSNGAPWDERVTFNAIINHHTDLLRWAVAESGAPWHSSSLGAICGWVDGPYDADIDEYIAWAREHGASWKNAMFFDTHVLFSSGRLDLIRQAVADGLSFSGGYMDMPFYFAIDGGHTNVVEWLLCEGNKLPSDALSHSLIGNNMSMFLWLYSVGAEFNEHLCSCAREEKRLWWLWLVSTVHQVDYPGWLRDSMRRDAAYYYSEAIDWGYEGMMVWLNETMGLPLEDRYCEWAVRRGVIAFPVLTWLIQKKGATITPEVVAAAREVKNNNALSLMGYKCEKQAEMCYPHHLHHHD